MPDERIVWSGRPNANKIFSQGDAFLVPFSLLWAGFAVFWEGSVILALLDGESESGNGGPLWMFVFFGIPFIVMGLYFVIGRFFYKHARQKRTHYAVTNRRAIVLYSWPKRRAISAFLRELATVETAFNPDGSGTIRFGASPWWPGSMDNSGLDPFDMYRANAIPIFYDVPGARDVFRLVNELKTSPTS